MQYRNMGKYGPPVSAVGLGWGTKRISYLEDNLAAVNVKLSQEELHKLNSIFPVRLSTVH